MKMTEKKILLVEPDFPIPGKSRNHKNFFPIGLLKIATYLKQFNNEIKLIRFDSNLMADNYENGKEFVPDYIFITSLFTYWSSYVKKTVQFYKKRYPNAIVNVGGIYASLMPIHCKEYTECDEVFTGTCKDAEDLVPDYSLIENIDFQIIHTTRGCTRECSCCGVYIIEPEFSHKFSIKNEVVKKIIVFYDNNLLANPHIKNILNEIIELRKIRKIRYCESQSGFDGRIIQKKPELGLLLKKAGFRHPKIAWDGPFSGHVNIEKQIEILVKAGYNRKEISIFMVYNSDLSFKEMEQKRVKCWKWSVQISDCRFRPLNQTYDHYSGFKKNQTSKDYYIHTNWSDSSVKKFRSNVRKHNICIRQTSLFYSAKMERKKIPKEEMVKYRNMNFNQAKKYLDDVWNPGKISCK